MCNLQTNEIKKVFDKISHDIIFDKNDSGRLFINSKGTIISFYIADGTTGKIYKFRNTTEAPIDMKQSGDGKFLLFHKYKSDQKKLHLLNLESGTLEQMIVNELSSPSVFGERLYFKVFVAGRQTRFEKWCSLNLQFNDFRIHCDHPGFWGGLHIYGDSSRPIFVVHCCSKEESPADRKWGCHIYDGGSQSLLEGYQPVHDC